MIHPSLPQTKTPEQLGEWIQENKINQIIHIEKTDLSEEEIQKIEHKVATVTKQLYDLDSLKKEFMETLNKGTDFDQTSETFLPQDFTIPPTKGIKKLEENRKYYSQILKDGFTTAEVQLFAIPNPEGETIVYVNIEGEENEFYRENMTEEQKIQFNSLFKEDSKSPLDV